MDRAIRLWLRLVGPAANACTEPLVRWAAAVFDDESLSDAWAGWKQASKMQEVGRQAFCQRLAPCLAQPQQSLPPSIGS
eukprot:2944056-Pyramimonas_sp.AAC.1